MDHCTRYTLRPRALSHPTITYQGHHTTSALEVGTNPGGRHRKSHSYERLGLQRVSNLSHVLFRNLKVQIHPQAVPVFHCAHRPRLGLTVRTVRPYGRTPDSILLRVIEREGKPPRTDHWGENSSADRVVKRMKLGTEPEYAPVRSMDATPVMTVVIGSKPRWHIGGQRPAYGAYRDARIRSETRRPQSVGAPTLGGAIDWRQLLATEYAPSLRIRCM